jgi:hypothetical protein
MTTTVLIDKEIKDKARNRAKLDNISIWTVTKLLLLDYAEWKINIQTRLKRNIKVSEIKVDIETQNKMDILYQLWNSKWK